MKETRTDINIENKIDMTDGPDVTQRPQSAQKAQRTQKTQRPQSAQKSQRPRKSRKSQKSQKSQRTAYEEGMKYLGARIRTESEMRTHLEEKEYSVSEINEVIADFKELRYLDDEYYVMVFAESAYGKGRGTRRIIAELAQKGIDKQLIYNALEDYKYEHNIDERELAYGIAKRTAEMELEGRDREFDERLSAKIARKLNQRGFETGMIYGILSELQQEFRLDE